MARAQQYTLMNIRVLAATLPVTFVAGIDTTSGSTDCIESIPTSNAEFLRRSDANSDRSTASDGWVPGWEGILSVSILRWAGANSGADDSTDAQYCVLESVTKINALPDNGAPGPKAMPRELPEHCAHFDFSDRVNAIKDLEHERWRLTLLRNGCVASSG